MRVFDFQYLVDLSAQAEASPRKRQHRNIHQSHQEPCQRLFNAIEPNSYIRPHRHAADPRDELLIAIRGLMALVTFDDQGNVLASLRFGSEKYSPEAALGAEVPENTWHTVIALQPGCILLEVKSGPFEENNAKELAPWAPEEGSESALRYLEELNEKIFTTKARELIKD
jgi:cupin fold WbuC family metalloprotein